MNYNYEYGLLIYNSLKSEGFTDQGAISLMANIYAESGFYPNNLQNTGNKKLNLTDAEYTAKVDNGTYTKFVRDANGYGLCQWTYWSRKQAMLNYAKSIKKSIGSFETNLGYLMQELRKNYPTILKELKTTKSIDTLTRLVMIKFENPYDQSESAQKKRVSYAEELYKDYVTNKKSESTNSSSNVVTEKEENVPYKLIRPVYYSQKDIKWKSLPYAVDGEKSTIGSAGCGPVSMAMVLASLVSPYIDPLTTISWARWKGYKVKSSGTAYSYLVPQGKAYGINVKQLNSANIYHKPTNPVHDTALAELKKGNWLIACMGPGVWTSGGHFILVYGYKDGKVYINDSNSTSTQRCCNTWEVFKNEVKVYWSIEVPDNIKKNGIKTTGTYKQTDFVREVQLCIGAGLDGVAGPQTLSKTITVSKTKNRKHHVVLPLMKKLKALKFYTGELDCTAGQLFDKGVKLYQKEKLKYSEKNQDGEITAKRTTWKHMLGLIK